VWRDYLAEFAPRLFQNWSRLVIGGRARLRPSRCPALHMLMTTRCRFSHLRLRPEGSFSVSPGWNPGL